MYTMETAPPEYDLTVVTVCWNAKDLIIPTVNDVLIQKKLGNIRIEHLFVDGASTDGTPELLEQLRQDGKIECYISEPDKGIFDAMNKAIRLASGKVLFFLNAGDRLLEGVDLAPLVQPIVKDECDATCGQWFKSNEERVRCSVFHLCYMDTPCCHQSFFMSTAWYEKLGGYNDRDFRCIADDDIMWKLYAAGGRIKDVARPVVTYLVGGFSFNSESHYTNEWLYIFHQHKDRVSELSRCNPDYARYLVVRLTMFVRFFTLYTQEKGRDEATLRRLQEFYAVVRSISGHHISKLMLRIMCGPGLRSFAAGKAGKLRQLLLWRLPALFLTWPKDAKYANYLWRLPLAAMLSGKK